MTDQCVACGEVAEGKPLYKKLGGHPDVEVFSALHTMNIISLPESAKNNYYLCWDCDETISEEYAEFCAREQKQKDDEIKRKHQDSVRNQKLNKKLKLAFKKVHQEDLFAQGFTPPVTTYKKRELNKYSANHCLLCDGDFETRNGYQRHNLRKMVDDEHNISKALEMLGQTVTDQATDLSRRFICCSCYNKLRRNFKTIQSGKKLLATDALQANGTSKKLKRATTDEHAAEIAKILPSVLVGMYKVVRKESEKSLEASTSPGVNTGQNFPNSPRKSKHPNKPKPPNHKYPSHQTTPKRKNSIATLLPKNYASSLNRPSPSSQSGASAICNVCGLCYTSRPPTFWCNLEDRLPSSKGTTIKKALQILETELADVDCVSRARGLVCKSCYSRVAQGFRYKLGSSSHDPSEPKKSPADANSSRSHPHKNMTIKKRILHPVHSKSVKKDLGLLKYINSAKQLRCKGKSVEVKGIYVNVLDVKEILPTKTYKPIATEHLKDMYKYSNFQRSIPSARDVGCVFCETVIKSKVCHWLDDPVHPPNLMVPIKWAQMSVGTDRYGDVSQWTGKVCDECHRKIAREFTQFATDKIITNREPSSSSEEALKKYKISFDSKALTVVADALRSPSSSPYKRDRKRSRSCSRDRHADHHSKKLKQDKSRTSKLDNNDNSIVNGLSTPKSNGVVSSHTNGVEKHETSFNVADDLALSDSDEDIEPTNPAQTDLNSQITKKPIEVEQPTKTEPETFESKPSVIASMKGKENICVENNNTDNYIFDANMKPGPLSRKLSRHRRMLKEQHSKKEKPLSQPEATVKEESVSPSTPTNTVQMSPEDEVAPFAQRKKPKGNKTPVQATIPVASVTAEPLPCLWHCVQELNLDDLVLQDIAQPVKPHQFTYGLFLALNDYRQHLGATVNELIDWLHKIFPNEWTKLKMNLSEGLIRTHVRQLDDGEPRTYSQCDIDQPLPRSWLITSDEQHCEPISICGYVADIPRDLNSCLSLVNLDELLDGNHAPLTADCFNHSLLSQLSKIVVLMNGGKLLWQFCLGKLSGGCLDASTFDQMVQNFPYPNRLETRQSQDPPSPTEETPPPDDSAIPTCSESQVQHPLPKSPPPICEDSVKVSASEEIQHSSPISKPVPENTSKLESSLFVKDEISDPATCEKPLLEIETKIKSAPKVEIEHPVSTESPSENIKDQPAIKKP